MSRWGVLRAASAFSLAGLGTLLKSAVHYLAQHTGLPVLLVAAILAAVGYRILKRSARFLAEVTILALLLFVLTALGWIRW